MLAADDDRPTAAPVVLLARDPEDPVHAGLCLDVRWLPAGVVAIDYHHLQSPSGAPGYADADVSMPDIVPGDQVARRAPAAVRRCVR